MLLCFKENNNNKSQGLNENVHFFSKIFIICIYKYFAGRKAMPKLKIMTIIMCIVCVCKKINALRFFFSKYLSQCTSKVFYLKLQYGGRPIFLFNVLLKLKFRKPNFKAATTRRPHYIDAIMFMSTMLLINAVETIQPVKHSSIAYIFIAFISIHPLISNTY